MVVLRSPRRRLQQRLSFTHDVSRFSSERLRSIESRSSTCQVVQGELVHSLYRHASGELAGLQKAVARAPGASWLFAWRRRASTRRLLLSLIIPRHYIFLPRKQYLRSHSDTRCSRCADPSPSLQAPSHPVRASPSCLAPCDIHLLTPAPRQFTPKSIKQEPGAPCPT